MIALTCDCCNFEQEFTDPEEAFHAGWDAPPHFTGYISCAICPITFLFGVDHTVIHEQWKIDGRPEEFSQETCVAPEQRVPEEELERIKEILLPLLGDNPRVN
jgi:hypothetical protein